MKSFTANSPRGPVRVIVEPSGFVLRQKSIVLSDSFPRIVDPSTEQEPGILVVTPTAQWEGRTASRLTADGIDAEDVRIARTSAIFLAENIGVLVGGRWDDRRQTVTGWRLDADTPTVETWHAQLVSVGRRCCGKVADPPAPEIVLPGLAFEVDG